MQEKESGCQTCKQKKPISNTKNWMYFSIGIYIFYCTIHTTIILLKDLIHFLMN